MNIIKVHKNLNYKFYVEEKDKVYYIINIIIIYNRIKLLHVSVF